MQFHYSICNVVQANGVQCIPHNQIDGALLPFILISDSSAKEELDKMDKAECDKVLSNQSLLDEIKLNPMALEGWFDPYICGNRPTSVNPFGFQIRCTPSGSMLKRTFYGFILHFVQHLPHDQCPDGQGVGRTYIQWTDAPLLEHVCYLYHYFV
jgi:hypothetical protein